MTNFEKFKDEILEKIDLPYAASAQFGVTEDGKIELCKNMECYECIFGGGYRCIERTLQWFKLEHVDISAGTDWQKVPVDTPVIVQNGKFRRKYYFSKVSGDLKMIYVFMAGKTESDSHGFFVAFPEKYVKLEKLEDKILYAKETGK